MSLKLFVLLITIACILILSNGFKITKTQTTSFKLSSTWQEEFDQFVDIDTSCDSRREVAQNLIKKVDSIANDVVTSIRERNVEKLAPTNLKYGKNLKGAQEFRKQLFNDIFPDLITNQIPKLVSEAPKIIQLATTDVPSKLMKRAEDSISFARDLSNDPSFLQSTVDDIRNEVKNVFKTTPVGLSTPNYTVLKSTITYEIRKYEPYAVASTELSESGFGGESDIISSGTSFNTLAGYILSGENDKSRKLSMTTPVIMSNGRMDFILPFTLSSSTAPTPNSDKITLKDVESEVIAVKEFSGIATEKEIARQRALLEDSLLADGIIYDNLSFKTLTYNPPYTLPWLRRNEVCLKVEYRLEDEMEPSPDTSVEFSE